MIHFDLIAWNTMSWKQIVFLNTWAKVLETKICWTLFTPCWAAASLTPPPHTHTHTQWKTVRCECFNLVDNNYTSSTGKPLLVEHKQTCHLLYGALDAQVMHSEPFSQSDEAPAKPSAALIIIGVNVVVTRRLAEEDRKHVFIATRIIVAILNNATRLFPSL